jgi:8-oxo-dGTP pyrophosphatase MutT (NUDIX family)
MKVRYKARAIVRDGDRLLFLRRVRPGADPYWTAVGGSVEPEDAGIEAALRREVMEEIGATVGPAVEVLTVAEPGDQVVVVQHFFLVDLVDMDLARRGGPELDDPDRGSYEPDWIALTADAIDAIDLKPAELADYVREHCASWRPGQETAR